MYFPFTLQNRVKMRRFAWMLCIGTLLFKPMHSNKILSSYLLPTCLLLCTKVNALIKHHTVHRFLDFKSYYPFHIVFTDTFSFLCINYIAIAKWHFQTHLFLKLQNKKQKQLQIRQFCRRIITHWV